ncbi:MAG: SPOR domain-containing protein [Halanaerobiales bacterium]
MERSNNMSLTVLVIVLAMLGLLVGYLLGNWFIQLVTGENPESSQLADPGNTVVEEEIILDEEGTEESSSENILLDSSPEIEGDTDTPDTNTGDTLGTNLQTENQLQSDNVYVIQVGAFNSLQNAKQLGNELTEKGFQVFIADENLPYKVQIGAFTDREKAEETEKKVKSLGYDTFITH